MIMGEGVNIFGGFLCGMDTWAARDLRLTKRNHYFCWEWPWSICSGSFSKALVFTCVFYHFYSLSSECNII